MGRVYVSVGSNMQREINIAAALDALRRLLDNVVESPVYESESVGFKGENFFNLVVVGDTEKSVGDLARSLAQIEAQQGRVRGGTRFGPRTLDLDLLLYGDRVFSADGINLPRNEITEYAFVLRPLADIAPHEVHPVLKKTYAELWRDFPRSGQRLWPADGLKT